MGVANPGMAGDSGRKEVGDDLPQHEPDAEAGPPRPPDDEQQEDVGPQLPQLKKRRASFVVYCLARGGSSRQQLHSNHALCMLAIWVQVLAFEQAHLDLLPCAQMYERKCTQLLHQPLL
jgi:hypothetical protein